MVLVDQSALRRAKLLLVVSLLLTGIAGACYVYGVWAARNQPIDGILRCVIFLCAMVAVHAWGYQAYRRQGVSCNGENAGRLPENPQPAVPALASPSTPNSRSRPNVGFILVQQFLAALIMSLVLDGGNLFWLCIASIATYWLSVGVLGCVRRVQRTPMTQIDVALMNGGFFPLFAVVTAAAQLVWWLKGLS